MSFVYCKNCKEKIEANPPQGNVQIEGNVTYNNVTMDGNSLNFGPGGELNLSNGGSVNFTSSGSRIKCNSCGKVFAYSKNEFHND